MNSAVCWCILTVFLLPSFKKKKYQLFRCCALHLSSYPALLSKFSIPSRSLLFFPITLDHNFSITFTPITASPPINYQIFFVNGFIFFSIWHVRTRFSNLSFFICQKDNFYTVSRLALYLTSLSALIPLVRNFCSSELSGKLDKNGVTSHIIFFLLSFTLLPMLVCISKYIILSWLWSLT